MKKLLFSLVALLVSLPVTLFSQGALTGLFTINANNDQVYFSKGNLQYIPARNQWLFAGNQFGFVGESNSEISPTRPGEIDLFGWGTSGYHFSGDANNVCYQPWSISFELVNSNYNYYGYGPSINSSAPHLTGQSAYYDWGVNCAIINGGDAPGLWFTPSGGIGGEWYYMFMERQTTSGYRFAKAKVVDVNGVILVPDNWSSDTYILNETDEFSAPFSSNVIDVTDWTTVLEPNGCVFLPAAGYRHGDRAIDSVGTMGYYWSSSCHDKSYANGLWFYDKGLFPGTGSSLRCQGASVRLVKMASQPSSPLMVETRYAAVSDKHAYIGGQITSDGGVAILESGFYWSTDANPILNGTKVVNETGAANFMIQQTGLTAGTKYYVCAFAINRFGIAYGTVMSFTTLTPPQGSVASLFTISAGGDRVYFSQGNLQYQASTNIWRFAEHQYDTIGGGNANLSSTYDGWIDLFGWGTSGYHDVTDVDARNYQPWSSSTIIVNGTNNAYGYGPSLQMSSLNLTGLSAQYDWGVSNAISNGGNVENQWHTLTSDEWNYLLFTRQVSSGHRLARATVNGIPGVILLPDDWSDDIIELTYDYQSGFTANIFDIATWNDMLEANGCVFLPMAGYRNGLSLVNLGSRGAYWSSTHVDSRNSNSFVFAYTVTSVKDMYRYYGNSVRLVCPESFSTYSPTVTTINISNITNMSATSGGQISHNDRPVVACGVCWATHPNPTRLDNYTVDPIGVANSFSSTMTGLLPQTEYYVRAYVTDGQQTVYGNEKSFQTFYCDGALNGKFTVNSSGDQILFSRGNLEYQASKNEWSFATDQTINLGIANQNISSTTSTSIDLFGWGTSGYNHGAEQYQPWSVSTDNTLFWAYGSNGTNLYDGNHKADWGYNSIINGGNVENQWRTLTKEEWDYLFNTRSTTTGLRFIKAYVPFEYGVVLFPDDWNEEDFSFEGENDGTLSFASNTISETDWAVMERRGCVFLPITYNRTGTSVNMSTNFGGYWSSSCYYDLDNNIFNACYLYFDANGLNATATGDRFVGRAVRLVCSPVLFLPTVSNPFITQITVNSVRCTSYVSYDNPSAVTSRGFCWATHTNPTLTDSYVTEEGGTDYFSSSLKNLHPGTTYYVRAYASDGQRYVYSSQSSFKTAASEGAINGRYTINSNGDQVFFSKGNLQYIGSAATPYWQFANYQWTYLGNNGQSAGGQNIDRDLFGWGTSGYHNSNDTYNVNYQPWSTTSEITSSSLNYSGYGPSLNMTDKDLTGTSANYDWGVYNAISNGGNKSGKWRLLTDAEMNMVVFNRSTSSGIRFAKAKVNDVNGLILFPDDWQPSSQAVVVEKNNPNAQYSVNVISRSTWVNFFETKGCVFLPAAGTIIAGLYQNNANVEGIYHTSTHTSDASSYENNDLVFEPYQSTQSHVRLSSSRRDIRRSVRLVQPAN